MNANFDQWTEFAIDLIVGRQRMKLILARLIIAFHKYDFESIKLILIWKVRGLVIHPQ